MNTIQMFSKPYGSNPDCYKEFYIYIYIFLCLDSLQYLQLQVCKKKLN